MTSVCLRSRSGYAARNGEIKVNAKFCYENLN